MTLSLPPHWGNRFREILSAIHCTKKQIGFDNRHWVLGMVHSMEINLPEDQVLFSHMQEALLQIKDKRLTLIKDINQTLVYFLCLAQDLERHTTSLYELVPIHPELDG